MHKLILLVVGSLFLVASHTPYPSGIAEGGPSVERAADGNASADTSNPKHEPIDVRLVGDPVDQERARQAEAKADEREKRALEIADLSANASDRQARLALPALIISGLGTLLVFAALVLSFLANRTSQRALALARNTAHAELRPYLDISQAKVDERDKSVDAWADGFRFKCRIVNYGQTPAFDVTTDVRWHRVIQSDVMYVDERHPSQMGCICPGDYFSTGWIEKPLGGGEAAQFLCGDFKLWIEIGITYSDAFGWHHHTEMILDVSKALGVVVREGTHRMTSKKHDGE